MYDKVIKRFFVWKKKGLENQFLDFSGSQNTTLDNIISKNKRVEYLKNHGINDIKSFNKNCPIVSYDDIEIHTHNVLKNRVNNISAEPIIAFSKSSGTTSRSKLIPMTESSIQANYNAGKILLGQYANAFPDTKIFKGKNFSLSGSYEFQNKFIIGDVSALFTYFLSPFYTTFKVPNKDIATIADWNQKLKEMIPILSKSDIRWIAGVPSWMSIVIEQIEEYSQKPIADVWKNLEVYFYGGVNIEPFRTFYEKKFKGNLRLWQTYNASEGFFGIQMSQEDGAMSLLPNTLNYYEFIPFNEIHTPHPTIVNYHELELDKNYELLITNSSGLYRYRIGDVIRVVNILPFRFEIVGRTKNYINTFGEELMVSNTEEAIALLSLEIDFSIKDYTIAPIMLGNTGYHNWLIEFNQAPQNIELFKTRLDAILRSLNSDYDAKRYHDIVLKSLKVEVLKSNTITKWLGKKNRINVQSKVPKLWNDISIQNELRALAN